VTVGASLGLSALLGMLRTKMCDIRAF
jgi:hypothetical protein